MTSSRPLFRWSGLAAFMALLAFASPAAAQPSARSLMGEWTVRTAPHQNTGCVISGTARVSRGENEGFAIDLRVRDVCPNGQTWNAQERCIGALEGAKFTVLCELVSADSDNYVADNFFLTVASASSMSGTLNDYAAWNEPVEWRRPGPGLTS